MLNVVRVVVGVGFNLKAYII